MGWMVVVMVTVLVVVVVVVAVRLWFWWWLCFGLDGGGGDDTFSCGSGGWLAHCCLISHTPAGRRSVTSS